MTTNDLTPETDRDWPDIPQVCDKCENPLRPYRWVDKSWPYFGKSCECAAPVPMPVDPLYRTCFTRA